MTESRTSPCSTKKLPTPESIVCPDCKAETEIWSDEEDASCHSCGRRIERTAEKYTKGGA